jgi:hypothetical protein
MQFASIKVETETKRGDSLELPHFLCRVFKLEKET